ncbi:CBL-interacting protein kinase 31-like [Panicum miliaceum]|uniref:non-specific serine/threonine protein kinase n=1 Tax=Panicum miliaceum TaxID=4540 RepID=A0A3L6T983_PANMI|nr:CBL-interacting protein kinase 31-like [Panicum miliaceum]
MYRAKRAASLKVKRRVGKYELGRTIGEGTFAKVMGSKTRIYIVLEFVMGGEVHDIVLENLLLDIAGNLKISDFGLSAISDQVKVIDDKGYDGALADLWSCGVILFVLLAGYLPFEDDNIASLYKKRITVPQVQKDPWFKKGYKPPVFDEECQASLDDVHAAFGYSEELLVTEEMEGQPTSMNAFELISMNKGLNLENFFESDKKYKRETRFASECPPKEIINRIEEAAKPLGFDVQKKNYKMLMENPKAGRKGNLNVATEVFQVAPSLHVVELKKAKGDTLEFQNFYRTLSMELKDVIWVCDDQVKDGTSTP